MTSSARPPERLYFAPDDLAGIEAAYGRGLSPAQRAFVERRAELHPDLRVGVDDTVEQPGSMAVGLVYTNERGKLVEQLIFSVAEAAQRLEAVWQHRGGRTRRTRSTQPDGRVTTCVAFLPVRPRASRLPRREGRAARPGFNTHRRGSRRAESGSRSGPDDPDGDPEPPALIGYWRHSRYGLLNRALAGFLIAHGEGDE